MTLPDCGRQSQWFAVWLSDSNHWSRRFHLPSPPLCDPRGRPHIVLLRQASCWWSWVPIWQQQSYFLLLTLLKKLPGMKGSLDCCLLLTGILFSAKPDKAVRRRWLGTWVLLVGVHSYYMTMSVMSLNLTSLKWGRKEVYNLFDNIGTKSAAALHECRYCANGLIIWNKDVSATST